MSALDDPREGRRALLSLLHDGENLIELRCFHPDGKIVKRWARTVPDADEIAASLTPQGVDVYVGVAPRLHRDKPTRERPAYAACRALWADCDSRRAVLNLEHFEPYPTAIVLSGGFDDSTPKRHAYWRLTSPLDPDQVRRHTLRVAHCLGSDRAVCEPARVLRLPGSKNHKSGKVATLLDFTGETHDLDAITGDLPDAGTVDYDRLANACVPDVKVRGGQRHPAMVSLLGLMRSWGACAEVLDAAAVAFVEHQCDHDGPPIDWEHVHETAADIARRY